MNILFLGKKKGIAVALLVWRAAIYNLLEPISIFKL